MWQTQNQIQTQEGEITPKVRMSFLYIILLLLLYHIYIALFSCYIHVQKCLAQLKYTMFKTDWKFKKVIYDPKTIYHLSVLHDISSRPVLHSYQES